MGEKGNLLDVGEEIFVSLAEQGPQFWIDYEQYKLARGRSAEAGTVAKGADAEDPAAQSPAQPAVG